MRQRQSALGEKGSEVGLRIEKSDSDFKEREHKLIKYVVQVLQVASVPSYIYDGTIARMHVICTLILKYTIFCHLQVQM